MRYTTDYRSSWLAPLAGMIVASIATAANSTEAVDRVPAPSQFYIEHEFQFVLSREIEDYLDGVVTKLLQGRTEKFDRPHLRVVSEENFDGRSDESGNLILSTETLRVLESEDELAALLGHELAHVVLHHPAHKSLIKSFPAAIESLAEIAMAGDEVVQSQKQNTTRLKPSKSLNKGMIGSENTCEFWSDIVATNWNRKQEREADRVGFDMMRAAGYDPSAFATLFSKLHAAQLKRGKRMEVLHQKLLAKAKAVTGQEKTATKAAGNSTDDLSTTMNDAAYAVSQKAIDALFDNFAKITADYDSPQQRQELLTKYVSEQPTVRRDKTARSEMFAKVLREGPGGSLLQMDANALQLRRALQASDDAGAASAGVAFATQAGLLLADSGEAKPGSGKAVRPVKAKTAGQSSGKGKSSSPTVKKTEDLTASQQASASHAVASPHLNAAAALWFQMNDKEDQADQQLVQWLSYSLAPPSAFVAHAENQSKHGEYQAAVATLEDGERRVGTPRPFLVAMVQVAKTAQDVPAAENYTRRCDEVQRSESGIADKMRSLLRRNSVPTGLYAECITVLGYAPAATEDAKDTNVASAAQTKDWLHRLTGGGGKGEPPADTVGGK